MPAQWLKRIRRTGQLTLFNKASGRSVSIESAVKSFNNLALGVRLCRQRGDDKVSAYDIGSNGAPTPIQGSPFRDGEQSHKDGSGSNGKVPLRGKLGRRQPLSLQHRQKRALTPVRGSPFAAGSGPIEVGT